MASSTSIYTVNDLVKELKQLREDITESKHYKQNNDAHIDTLRSTATQIINEGSEAPEPRRIIEQLERAHKHFSNSQEHLRRGVSTLDTYIEKNFSRAAAKSTSQPEKVADKAEHEISTDQQTTRETKRSQKILNLLKSGMTLAKGAASVIATICLAWGLVAGASVASTLTMTLFILKMIKFGKVLVSGTELYLNRKDMENRKKQTMRSNYF